MRKRGIIGGWLTVLALVLLALTNNPAHAMVVNHANLPGVDQMPMEWVNAAKEDVAWQYAHTSHGEQLTIGLAHMYDQDGRFASVSGFGELPGDPGHLQIFDGQNWDDTYITPDLYWESEYGRSLTRNVLNNNPEINVSGWAWCTQLDYYSAEEVQGYLDTMASFEREFPNVTFVYFTGNAQATGYDGYNRHMRNNQIRDWVNSDPSGQRVLFDFADLDSWAYNSGSGQWEQSTYNYNGMAIPVEHAQFHGDECGHTTAASCEQKGLATWWMLSQIAAGNRGWQ
ncbi:MAG: hypothetical protein PVG03_16835 [Desulfarculaceae bacterium]|jgi:hypothetical protein